MIDDYLDPGDEVSQYADVEMLGISEQDEILREIELMGYDVNEVDLMGGPFKRLFRRIRDRVRARRKARAEKKARASLPAEQQYPAAASVETPYTISTPRGSLTSSSTGLAFTKPASGVVMQQTGMQNPLAMLTQNPILLAIPAGLILLMVMGKKDRGSRKR